MSRIKAPSNLPELVRAAFAKARSEGDLNYYPTQVAVIPAAGLLFQLRFSPALANKPKAAPRTSTTPFDPFASPPPALKITDLPPAHYLVLNKFAIVPEHFILATTAFEPQTHVLDAEDLAATAACVAAYEDEEEGLFAFFNSGEHSGASQAHRHIQLLPVARMKDGMGQETPWGVLASTLTERKAPFVTFAEKISLGMSGQEIHDVYLKLYREAVRAVAKHGGGSDDAQNGEAPDKGESLISYNMAMTKDTLVICPRLSEGAEIHSQDAKVQGSLLLNGTVLAGTALVKNEAEWQALNANPDDLLRVLRGIGIPSEGVDEGGRL